MKFSECEFDLPNATPKVI